MLTSGARAARLSSTTAAGSYAYLRKDVPAGLTRLTVRFNIRVNVEGAAGTNVPLLRLYDASGVRLVAVYRQNATGGEVWSRHTGMYKSTTAALDLGTWKTVDVTTDSAAGTLVIKVAGLTVYSGTGVQLGTGVRAFQVGSDSLSETFDLVVDDVAAYAGDAPVDPVGPFVPTVGDAMPTSDLFGWRMIFSDDFLSPIAAGAFPADRTRWLMNQVGEHDTSGNGTYDPRIVTASDGMLDLHLRTENGVHLVAKPSARLPSGTADQLYGRYAVRFRADPVAGYKTAWLLWPKSGAWPRDGEIDFPEGNLDGTIKAYMHRQGATTEGDQDYYLTSETYPTWHTAVIEWSPGVVEFILDGVTIGRSTSRVPNTAMHWVLQTETALDGTVPSDTADGHVQIDWVAIWAYAP